SVAVALFERRRMHRHSDSALRDLDPADHAAERLLTFTLSQLAKVRCDPARPFVLGEHVEDGVHNHLLEFARWKARNAAGFLCPTLHDGLTDVVTVPLALLDRVAGAHAIAGAIEDQTLEQSRRCDPFVRAEGMVVGGE